MGRFQCSNTRLAYLHLGLLLNLPGPAVGTVILFLLHPVLSARLLKLFHASSFGGISVLTVDPSLGFDDIAGYRQTGIFFLLLYTLGIPLFFFVTLWQTARPRPPSALEGAAAAREEKLQARRAVRYELLYSIYEPWCWRVAAD